MCIELVSQGNCGIQWEEDLLYLEAELKVTRYKTHERQFTHSSAFVA